MGRATAKTERLEARIPTDVKATLVRAASARQVIQESEVLELSERDQIAFAEALLKPPAALPDLVGAARRYRGEPG